MTRPAIDRFMEKVRVDDETGCWLWTASINSDGYGWFRDGRMFHAHRWSYTHHVGTIAAGLQVDHLCRVRHCVNPSHLEAVTPRENIMRSTLPQVARAQKLAITHCPAGHEYTVQNTLRTVSATGAQTRACRTCHRLRERARRVRIAAARKANT